MKRVSIMKNVNSNITRAKISEYNQKRIEINKLNHMNSSILIF